MCGICGIYTPQNNKYKEGLKPHIDTMCSLIEHRGPDEKGLHIDAENGLALGHQRLSIIDVSTGQQPMTNEDGMVWVVFNGEIYNHNILRQELLSKGHQFRTKSDTETIVHAYEEWGEDCVTHFRGMFAFVVWDKSKRKLFCARDRLGIKPFYYYWDGHNFLFSSELKSIISHPLVKRSINNSSLVDYFRLQYVPAPKSILNDVQKLQPGRTLTIHDGNIRINRFWEIDLDDRSKLSIEDAQESLRNTLQESVDIRLESEVPIGAFLSGGTDSSIIVALMSQLMNDSVKTHCIGFDHKEFDESHFARIIADQFKTDHEETFIDIDIDKNIEKIIWHMDEPFSDSSAIPTYLLCQETKKRVTVCLSGDGGDELFSGYNWYDEIRKLNKLDSKFPLFIRKLISKGLFSGLDTNMRGATFLKNIGASDADRHVNLRSCFSDSHISKIINKDILDSHFQNNPLLDLYSSLQSSDDAIKKAQWVDVQSYMSEDILMKVDKMSMAHALEVRVPILDHNVVNFAFMENTDRKINSKSRKILFKNSVSDLVSPRFFDRKKQGFSVPLRDWLLKDLKDRVGDYLLSHNSRGSGVFNRQEVNKLWNTFENDRLNIDLSNHIWSLLCYEMWHEEFIN